MHVGSQNALALPCALAPESGPLTGRLAARFFLRSGDPAPAFDGSLFAPADDGLAVRGGWGDPARSRARLALAVAAGAGLLAATLAVAGSRRA